MGSKQIAEEIAKEYGLTLTGRDVFKHKQLVEAIERGIAAAQDATGWRRAERELPPPGGPGDWVFVLTVGAVLQTAYVEAGAWHLPNGDVFPYDVTHWRPRFEAPPLYQWPAE